MPTEASDTAVRRQPNERERAFMAALTKPESNLTSAKLEAGYPKTTPTSRIIQSIQQTTLAPLLDEVGCDDKYLAQRILEGTKATRTVRVGAEDFIEETDWNAAHKFVATALKLKGYDRNQHDVNVRHSGTVEHDMAGMMVGAMKIFAASAGVEVDEAALKAEVASMAGVVEAEVEVEDGS